MKTFIELLESKSVPRRVFSHYYRNSNEVPKEKRTYPRILKEDLMNELKPIIDKLDLKIIDLFPGWECYNYIDPKNSKELVIYGDLKIISETWYLKKVSSKEILGSFLTKKDALEALTIFKDLQKKMLYSSFYVEIKKGENQTLNLNDLSKVLEREDIDLDISYIDDISSQWFYEEGPQWDKFKQEHRGHFAAKNFGQ